MTPPFPRAPGDPPSRSIRVAASFRDPSGYVFRRGQDIFRALDEDSFGVLRRLVANGTFAQLIQEQAIVRTQFVEDPELTETLSSEHPGFQQFLRHEPLDPITYPYEWPISMLADAAALTLDLQMRLLSSGCSLKDATPYNIQFMNGRPVFIDLSSFERPRRLDLWFALGQFAQMFTFPILLCRYAGWDLRSYFLANLGGLGIEEVARNFSLLRRLRPRLLLDLTLPLWLHRWVEKGQRARREVLDKRRDNPRPQVLNLRRLRSKITKLASSHKPSGVWSEYARVCNYDETAERAKQSLVAEFLKARRPKRVLDLGCNTGAYSRLAAENGATVLAVDSDHDAVEVLYRRLRENPAPISPMVVDLCNPSPAIGYMNRERPAFLDRVAADCVLALALMHHLLVSGNLPLAAIRDMMLAMTRRDLVLEFIPPEDDMFRRLLKFRVDLFDGLTLERCREVFLGRFRLLKEEPVPHSTRTLLFLTKNPPLGE